MNVPINYESLSFYQFIQTSSSAYEAYRLLPNTPLPGHFNVKWNIYRDPNYMLKHPH